MITLPDAKARVMYLPAFVNWKRDKPGTLKAASRRIDSEYQVTFTGISPADAGAFA